MKSTCLVYKPTKKLKFQTFEKVLSKVIERYPHAVIEGSINYYRWISNDTIIAETWLNKNTKFWLLIIHW